MAEYTTQRRYQRLSISAPVTILIENAGTRSPQVMRMVDVSEHGVRVRGRVQLSPGQITELIPNEGPRYGVRARVIWGKVVPGSEEVEFGMEFLSAHPTDAWDTAA